jgi:hypothetical protein
MNFRNCHRNSNSVTVIAHERHGNFPNTALGRVLDNPVRLKVFYAERMNEAVFAFRRYEDDSLRYTGIESHEGLTHYGPYDPVVTRE